MTDQEFKTLALSAKADVVLEGIRREYDYDKAIDMVLRLHREVVEYSVREGPHMPHGRHGLFGLERGPLEGLASVLGTSYRCECDLSGGSSAGLFDVVYNGTELEAYSACATLKALEVVAARAARAVLLSTRPRRTKRVDLTRVPSRMRMIVGSICVSLARQAVEMGIPDAPSASYACDMLLRQDGFARGMTKAFAALGSRPDPEELCQCATIAVRSCAGIASMLEEESNDLEQDVYAEQLACVVSADDEWVLDLARWCAYALDCAAFARQWPDGHAVFFVGFRSDASVAAAMCGAMVLSVVSESRRWEHGKSDWDKTMLIARYGKALASARSRFKRAKLPSVGPLSRQGHHRGGRHVAGLVMERVAPQWDRMVEGMVYEMGYQTKVIPKRVRTVVR